MAISTLYAQATCLMPAHHCPGVRPHVVAALAFASDARHQIHLAAGPCVSAGTAQLRKGCCTPFRQVASCPEPHTRLKVPAQPCRSRPADAEPLDADCDVCAGSARVLLVKLCGMQQFESRVTVGWEVSEFVYL